VNLGDTNFEDAFGGPGWLLQGFPDAYAASELKDSHGKTLLPLVALDQQFANGTSSEVHGLADLTVGAGCS